MSDEVRPIVGEYERFENYIARVLTSAAMAENWRRIMQCSSLGGAPVEYHHEPAHWLREAARYHEQVGTLRSRPLGVQWPAVDIVEAMSMEIAEIRSISAEAAKEINRLTAELAARPPRPADGGMLLTETDVRVRVETETRVLKHEVERLALRVRELERELAQTIEAHNEAGWSFR